MFASLAQHLHECADLRVAGCADVEIANRNSKRANTKFERNRALHANPFGDIANIFIIQLGAGDNVKFLGRFARKSIANFLRCCSCHGNVVLHVTCPHLNVHDSRSGKRSKTEFKR